MENYPGEYSKLTLEELEKVIGKLFHGREIDRPVRDQWPIGLCSIEHLAHLRKFMPMCILESLGWPNLYHIGNGCVTGIGGWKMFQDALMKTGLATWPDPSKTPPGAD